MATTKSAHNSVVRCGSLDREWQSVAKLVPSTLFPVLYRMILEFLKPWLLSLPLWRVSTMKLYVVVNDPSILPGHCSWTPQKSFTIGLLSIICFRRQPCTLQVILSFLSCSCRTELSHAGQLLPLSLLLLAVPQHEHTNLLVSDYTPLQDAVSYLFLVV